MAGFHKGDPREGEIMVQNEPTVLSTGLDQIEAALGRPRGFPEATCPRCGDSEARVTLYLDDIASFHCDGCDADFSADEVLSLIRGWLPVLEWVALSPAKGG